LHFHTGRNTLSWPGHIVRTILPLNSIEFNGGLWHTEAERVLGEGRRVDQVSYTSVIIIVGLVLMCAMQLWNRAAAYFVDPEECEAQIISNNPSAKSQIMLHLHMNSGRTFSKRSRTIVFKTTDGRTFRHTVEEKFLHIYPELETGILTYRWKKVLRFDRFHHCYDRTNDVYPLLKGRNKHRNLTIKEGLENGEAEKPGGPAESA